MQSGLVRGAAVAPVDGTVWTVDPRFATSSTWPGVNRIYAGRVVAPRSGMLVDLACYPTAASGNFEIGVYDASVNLRNRFYTSGTLAMSTLTLNAWNVFPANVGVRAGDHLDLFLWCDNTTGAFARTAVANPQLPAGFVVAPAGGSPKLGWVLTGATTGSSAQLAESSLAAPGIVPCLIARVA